MSEPVRVEPHESQALANALLHFLAERIDAGRTELEQVGNEALARVYTSALRLGIEAHALATRRHSAQNPSPHPRGSQR
ncbi:MAG: hypothetical protein JWR07_78 [Nevskia sp.]|nr:hypothetical protein [Nevskia sp.]